MFPWTRKEPAQDDLQTRVRKLETEVTALKLEWTDLLDKVLHRLQRAAKRDRDTIAAQAEAVGPTNGLPGVVGDGFDRKAALRARIRGLGR